MIDVYHRILRDWLLEREKIGKGLARGEPLTQNPRNDPNSPFHWTKMLDFMAEQGPVIYDVEHWVGPSVRYGLLMQTHAIGTPADVIFKREIVAWGKRLSQHASDLPDPDPWGKVNHQCFRRHNDGLLQKWSLECFDLPRTFQSTLF